MYCAIETETKETIAVKKKQIEQNQLEINVAVLEMADKLNQINRLKGQVEQLEKEMYQLENRSASKVCTGDIIKQAVTNFRENDRAL